MATTLEFLKQQLEQVDSQIEPLAQLRSTLCEQIQGIADANKLAEYGLKKGDALKFTPQCAQYNHLRISELRDILNETVYISALNYEQVVLSKYPTGGGVAYAATFEMARRMKLAQS